MVMGSADHKRLRVVVAFLAIVATVGVLVVWLGRISRNGRQEVLTLSKQSPRQANSASVVSTSASPSSNASPALPPTLSPMLSASPALPTPFPPTLNASPGLQIPPGMAPNNLIIPVAGVRPNELRDTFSESRAEGRVHDAIDIAAPLGTPVLAAADGTILKLFQ